MPDIRGAIEAAQRIYEQLGMWSSIDRALAAVSNGLPGSGRAEVFAKTKAINSFYDTNVWAIYRVSDHLSEILSSEPKLDPELVERLATVRDSSTKAGFRYYHSFASKYAHFFLSPDVFPIFDAMAEKVLRQILGSKLRLGEHEGKYLRFVDRMNSAFGGLLGEYNWGQIDRFLWLVGQLQALHSNLDNVNKELKDFAERGDLTAELREALTLLEVYSDGN